MSGRHTQGVSDSAVGDISAVRTFIENFVKFFQAMRSAITREVPRGVSGSAAEDISAVRALILMSVLYNWEM